MIKKINNFLKLYYINGKVEVLFCFKLWFFIKVYFSLVDFCNYVLEIFFKVRFLFFKNLFKFK